ncbi:PucR family transcriptional regulator ligand-binding domain-containing protein [Streptomyces sp. GMR22]|uniref:PucR family transcriptional regulator ligand-binding domain-containing protein n=1 Tax=Streptomyces sp. GMR22 TaxID=2759524 RepID=UPI0015F94CCE|nr:PucR family transcriptional regulator ligand-binding domain-containing protein [Streptomyces sp. GMR22]MBA6438788.1 PucR family transcriptional regulator ligand-binding domain-containing protein [Streptomyces sp. GMR22]
MRLRALLENDTLGLRLLGGEDELDRTVRGVMTTDLRDPSRYLSGGELVLTGLAWRREPEDSERFVRILAAAGVAGLAAGEAELGAVPEDLVLACGRHRLPLFSVVEDVAFATITEHVVRQVSGERAGDLAAVVDRHRRLMTSGPAGGGPEVVLDLLRSDLDLTAWVLSPTGRRIAGPTAAGSAAEPSAAVRAQLAGEQLAARRDGPRGPHRLTAADGMTYSLFPIRSGDPGDDVRETVLSDWVLAVGADADEWPEERLDLLYGVTQLIAVERDRRNASRTVRRRLAQEVLELVQSGAPPAEIAARLRVAAPVLLPGLGTAPHWQVVVARVEWGVTAERERGGDGGARGGGDGGALPGSGRKGADGGAREGAARDGATGATGATRDGSARDRGAREASSPDGRGVPGGIPGGITGGPVAQSLLEEILVDPYATGPEPSDRIAVAHTGDEAVALVPLPALGDGPSDGATGHPDAEGVQADALLATVREPLARGLAGDGRLTLGVSAAVHSADGLRGALEEARHARRVAAARPGRVCAAGHQELASHVLLLPFVPDDVRRAFTARLLDPLREYDRRHRAELIPTLEAFLDCDGSWTRCAARLHLHVNTLRYRVGRIEQLTGRELSRLEDKLDFFLALRMS